MFERSMNKSPRIKYKETKFEPISGGSVRNVIRRKKNFFDICY